LCWESGGRNETITVDSGVPGSELQVSKNEENKSETGSDSFAL